MLDERFESYLEDVEFGLRCASNGYSGVYVPDAVAYHKGSATLGRWNPRTVRQIARNQVLLLAKHYPAGSAPGEWLGDCGRSTTLGRAWRYGICGGWSWLAGKIEGLEVLYREARTAGSPGLGGVIRESEAELLSLQRETGSDWYWRVYVALT